MKTKPNKSVQKLKIETKEDAASARKILEAFYKAQGINPNKTTINRPNITKKK